MQKIVTLVSLCFLTFGAALNVHAQQTIFNVPSPDVLAPKKFYLETDWYIRSWETSSGQTGAYYVRGVAGVGANIEVGINTGPYDVMNVDDPFIDGTIKWRPFMKEFSKTKSSPGVVEIYMGTLVGVGLHDQVKGKGRNLTYAAGSIKLPTLQTRIAVGPYFATKYEFGERRFGALVTFEQPIPWISGFELAADWYSGEGAYFTPGIIYSRWNFTLYLGYGLSNTDRANNVITAELGYLF